MSPANLSWDEYLPHGGCCGVSMGTNFPMGLPRLVTVMPSPVAATSSMSLRHFALNSEALIIRDSCVAMLDTNDSGDRETGGCQSQFRHSVHKVTMLLTMIMAGRHRWISTNQTVGWLQSLVGPQGY